VILLFLWLLWLQTATSTQLLKLTRPILFTRFTRFALASLKMRTISLRLAKWYKQKCRAYFCVVVPSRLAQFTTGNQTGAIKLLEFETTTLQAALYSLDGQHGGIPLIFAKAAGERASVPRNQKSAKLFTSTTEQSSSTFLANLFSRACLLH
jgi:hypothetical protein